ncbi:MAG: PilZ domain-containing protein [Phycisphaerales bacterium JB041]
MTGSTPPNDESVGAQERGASAASLPPGVSASRREVERVKFPHDGSVALAGPAAGASPIRVRCRDLSSKGVGLVCGVRLEPGARCTVQLTNPVGKVVSVPGTVIRCRALSASSNEIGVRFEAPINLSDFVPTD